MSLYSTQKLYIYLRGLINPGNQEKKHAKKNSFKFRRICFLEGEESDIASLSFMFQADVKDMYSYLLL